MEEVVSQLVNNLESAPQQQNLPTISPAPALLFIAYVRSTLDETLADAGFDTVPQNMKKKTPIQTMAT
ncbi:hypothetical protein O9992_20350 [Vibrio lentus]|nr:hypothetical protein [Vibrio lentus]